MSSDNEKRYINGSNANIDETLLRTEHRTSVELIAELEKKMSMEKERYEKEINQLKDEKKVGPKGAITVYTTTPLRGHERGSDPLLLCKGYPFFYKKIREE